MERLKKIFKSMQKPKETATAIPPLERAMVPKTETRIIRGDK